MMDINFEHEYRLPVCDSLREMRIQSHLMDYGSNIFVEDMLEHGYIKLYEYFGGTFYLPANTEEMKHYQKNVVPIAGINISVKEAEQIVQVEKIYYEFGYEAYITKLMRQIMGFADFYNMKVSILDLRKNTNVKKTQHCRFVDVLSC